jgi:hypothetical protein
VEGDLALTDFGVGVEIELTAPSPAGGNVRRPARPSPKTPSSGSMMMMFTSFLGVLLITLVVFLIVWAIGRITLGR